jgi:hypothetical protein
MSVRALSPAERLRFSRAPVLAPLTLADIALEALLAELAKRHGRLDPSACPHGYVPLQQQRATMIVALSRSLQSLLADYDAAMLDELIAEQNPT